MSAAQEALDALCRAANEIADDPRRGRAWGFLRVAAREMGLRPGERERDPVAPPRPGDYSGCRISAEVTNTVDPPRHPAGSGDGAGPT